MKITILLSFLLFILSCNRPVKKNESISLKSKETALQVKDTLPYASYLTDVFGDNINMLQSRKDSVLFYDTYRVKFSENDKEKHIAIRFEDCSVAFNSFELNSDFELLKTSTWLEEALPHKDLFYKKDGYLVVFDYLKYCGAHIPTDFFLETVRIYKIEDYLEVSHDSHAIGYILKTID